MTNQTQHTAGPWKYEAATKTIRGVPNNYWLATMDSFDGAVNHEANARLIAAAPEMLEALKYAAELVKVARRYFPKSVRNSDTFQLENTCATIGKAIAKAEGNDKQLSDSGTVSPMILGAFWIVPAVWLLMHFAVLQVVASFGR